MAWFLVPYKTKSLPPFGQGRYCAMDDFTAQITADGGRWAEAECLGNYAVVKVVALPATIAAINAAAGFVRIPVDALDNTLQSLSTAQRNAITNKLQELGYSLTEIRAQLGNNIGTRTLGDVLRFALKRRLKARYDATGAIILDGPEQVCATVESIDAQV